MHGIIPRSTVAHSFSYKQCPVCNSTDILQNSALPRPCSRCYNEGKLVLTRLSLTFNVTQRRSWLRDVTTTTRNGRTCSFPAKFRKISKNIFPGGINGIGLQNLPVQRLTSRIALSSPTENASNFRARMDPAKRKHVHQKCFIHSTTPPSGGGIRLLFLIRQKHP